MCLCAGVHTCPLVDQTASQCLYLGWCAYCRRKNESDLHYQALQAEYSEGLLNRQVGEKLQQLCCCHRTCMMLTAFPSALMFRARFPVFCLAHALSAALLQCLKRPLCALWPTLCCSLDGRHAHSNWLQFQGKACDVNSCKHCMCQRTECQCCAAVNMLLTAAQFSTHACLLCFAGIAFD